MVWILLSLLLISGTANETNLQATVTAYWDYLQKHDKSAALEFVAPESRNDFINRRGPYFRNWQLVSIELKSAQEATVTIQLAALIEGAPGIYRISSIDTWIHDGESWKIRLPKISSEVLRNLYSGPGPDPGKELPPQLEVLPELLRIHFLSPTQRGTLVVRNGLDRTWLLTRIDFDESRFEIIDKPDQIESGKTARIVIRYKGDEQAKELKSEITLHLQHTGEEKTVIIPVLYNHLSPGARGLMGLTREKAEELKRGDPVKPSLPTPSPRP